MLKYFKIPQNTKDFLFWSSQGWALGIPGTAVQYNSKTRTRAQAWDSKNAKHTNISMKYVVGILRYVRGLLGFSSMGSLAGPTQPTLGSWRGRCPEEIGPLVRSLLKGSCYDHVGCDSLSFSDVADLYLNYVREFFFTFLSRTWSAG